MHAVLYFKISMFYKFKFTTTLSLILKIVTSLDFCLYVPNVFPGNYVQYQAVFSRPSYDHSVQQPKCSYPVNTCNGWRTWKSSRKISDKPDWLRKQHPPFDWLIHEDHKKKNQTRPVTVGALCSISYTICCLQKQNPDTFVWRICSRG